MKKNETIIVSGMKRSGAAMIMQILEALDIPVVKGAEPNSTHPGGNYEDPMLREGVTVEDYAGCAIKVIVVWLENTTIENKKLILCIRSPQAIAASNMLKKHNFDSNEAITKNYIARMSNVLEKKLHKGALIVDFDDIIDNPKKQIDRIISYLKLKSTPAVKKKAMKIINPKWRRATNFKGWDNKEDGEEAVKIYKKLRALIKD